MIRNSLALLVLVLVFVGCATDPTSNALYGRQNEFDRRIAEAREAAQFAPSPERDMFDTRHLNCLIYQRQYVHELNDARRGGITPLELRAYEFAFEQEIKLMEAQAAQLKLLQ